MLQRRKTRPKGGRIMCRRVSACSKGLDTLNSVFSLPEGWVLFCSIVSGPWQGINRWGLAGKGQQKASCIAGVGAWELPLGYSTGGSSTFSSCLPDDRHRVKLHPLLGDPNSDYINANYIDVSRDRSVGLSFLRASGSVYPGGSSGRPHHVSLKSPPALCPSAICACFCCCPLLLYLSFILSFCLSLLSHSLLHAFCMAPGLLSSVVRGCRGGGGTWGWAGGLHCADGAPLVPAVHESEQSLALGMVSHVPLQQCQDQGRLETLGSGKGKVREKTGALQAPWKLQVLLPDLGQDGDPAALSSKRGLIPL